MPSKRTALKVEEVSKDQSKKMTFTFKSMLGIFIAAFSILAILAKQNPYFGFDLSITLFIQSIHNPIIDFYLRGISIMGNPEWALYVVIVLATALISLGKRFYALYFVLSVFSVAIVTFILKYIVARPRPSPELINQISSHLYNDSFPSGHVTFFIGCFGFIAYLAYTRVKLLLLKWLILTICITLIATVGISRIYVGAHWFSDTLGAYLIGSVCLYLMIHLFQNNRRNT